MVALAAIAGSSAADPDGGLWLEGDWYVLVHYRDPAGDDPERIAWDDEIWHIEGPADRPSWIVYPHVVLDDASGRSVRLPSGAEARTLGAWSPGPRQLAEIRDGLTPDPHEARRKTLRGSAASGYRSTGAARPGSASAIGYAQEWTIGDVLDRPVFMFRDTLSSARAEPARGRTAFTTRERSAGSDELRGDYERDGVLIGEFRMIRMGADPAGER